MGLKCRIEINAFGKTEAYNADGTPSKLYKDLLDYFENEEQALNLWSETETEAFKAISIRKPQKEITLTDVLTFRDTINSLDRKMTLEQKSEVRSIMKNYGYSSLSELYKELVSIFKPNGTFTVNNERAINSELYSQEDLKDLDLLAVNQFLINIEGELLHGDIYNTEGRREVGYRDNISPKTSLGIAPYFSETTIKEELVQNIKDFSNTEEIYKAVSELPYIAFTERFFSDSIFADKFINEVQGLKQIPTLSISINGEIKLLTDLNDTTVRNTIRDDKSSIAIEASLEYLESVDEVLWDKHNDAIKEIVRKAEEKAIDANIDIIGLSDLSQNRDAILDTLWYVNKALQDPVVSQSALITQLEKYLPKPQNKVVEKIPSKYARLNIVTINAQLTDNELFSRFGLIKIGEGLYHNVKKDANPSELYEYIYNKVVQGAIEIPAKFITTPNYKSIEAKKSFLKDIETFINARDLGINVEARELVSLYQVAFKHSPAVKVDVKNKLKNLAGITTDTAYLKEGFVSDFYNYILTEKAKNSQVYRDTLQYFNITDRDISLTKRVDSLNGVVFKRDLEEYIRLKGDTVMDYLLPVSSNTDADVQNALQAVNFPETLKSIEQLALKPIKDGDMYIASKSVVEDYFRDGKQVYKSTFVDSKNKVFVPINSNQDVSVYYNTNTKFSYDAKKAKELLKRFNSRPIQYTESIPLDEIINKAGLSSNILIELERMKTDRLSVMKELLGKKTITVDGNFIRFEKDSTLALKPRSVQVAIFRDAAELGNKKLKEKLKDYYTGTPLTYNSDENALQFNLNSDKIVEELRLDASEIEAMNQVLSEVNNNRFDYFEGVVLEELQRGVDAKVLRDMGVDIPANLKNVVASIVDSKIEFVSLPNITEELSSYNKVGDCG